MSRLPTGPRAHDRALLGALLLCCAYEVLGYGLVALPLLNATAASGIAQFPDPDQRLFGGGGLLLLELLSNQQASLLQSLLPAGGLLALVSLGSFLPEWWLLEVLARRRGGAPAPAAPALLRLAVLSTCAWVLRNVVPTLGLMLGLSVLTQNGWGDAPFGFVVLVGLATVGAPVRAAISLFRDLSAVAVVCEARPLRPALRSAWARLCRRPLGLALRYAALLLLSSRLLSVGTALLGARGTLALVLHGVALLLGTALEAWWLGWLTAGQPRTALRTAPD